MRLRTFPALFSPTSSRISQTPTQTSCSRCRHPTASNGSPAHWESATTRTSSPTPRTCPRSHRVCGGLLRYYGFDTVSVLKGGLAAWRAAGLPVTDEPTPPPTPRPFRARPQERLLARRDDVAAVGHTDTCLVHALSEAEFRGDGLPVNVRAGHIPGSINVPWYSVIDQSTGRYKTQDELVRHFAEAGVEHDNAIITYCGGGIAASMDAFALALTGRYDIKVYDGSLAEWSADPSRPLTRG